MNQLAREGARAQSQGESGYKPDRWLRPRYAKAILRIPSAGSTTTTVAVVPMARNDRCTKIGDDDVVGAVNATCLRK